jgi:uncharacterized membrane protein HdeD (DUF308 family)
MLQDAFCPHCGAKRPEWARFCGSCGNGYDAPSRTAAVAPPPLPVVQVPSIAAVGPQPLSPATTPAANPTQLSMLAGVAWLLAGGLIAYLALLQLGIADAYPEAGQAAMWNGATAALSIAAGAALIARPSKGLLLGSLLFALVSVVWQVLQIAGGVTHPTYLGATVAQLAAGILSWAAWSKWIDPVPVGWVECPKCHKSSPPNVSGLCPNCGGPFPRPVAG